MPQSNSSQRMEQLIKTYIQACNNADAEEIAACFRTEAVHYGPSGPKWSGTATIGSNLAKRIQEQGYSWTVDQLCSDVDRCTVALEWCQATDKTGPLATLITGPPFLTRRVCE